MINEVNIAVKERLTIKSQIEGYMTIEEMTKELNRLSEKLMDNPDGEFGVVRLMQLDSMKALIDAINKTVDAYS